MMAEAKEKLSSAWGKAALWVRLAETGENPR
jgi:hypothetical protein